MLRNFMIFFLAVVVVASTQILRRSSAADEALKPKVNHYLEFLNSGKDFPTECVASRSAESDKKDTRDSVDKVIGKYHEVMNCVFNRRTKILVGKLLNDDKPLTKEQLDVILEQLSPPPIKLDANKAPIGREKCEGAGQEPSLSPYCIAQIGAAEYFDFREAMNAARRQQKDQAGTKFETLSGKKVGDPGAREVPAFEQRNIFGAIGDVLQGEKAIQGYGETINRIDREVDIARQTLDQALATYNELALSLPMHQKYKQMMSLLEDYRDKVADIRHAVDLYPITFLDITTPACK